MSAAYAHGQSRPNDGFDVHDAGKIFASQPGYKPVHPLKVGIGTPMRNTDVHMVRESNSAVDGRINNLGREETVGTLPHQEQAALRSWFELETIRKVEVGVKQH